MGRTILLLTAMAVMVLAYAGLALAETPSGTRDAYALPTTETGSKVPVHPGFERAQPFVAINSGKVTSVQVILSHLGGTSGDNLEAQVTATDASGLPTDEVLASSNIPTDDVVLDPGRGTVTVIFDTPAEIVAGRRYAIVLRTVNNSGPSLYFWHGTSDFSGSHAVHPTGSPWLQTAGTLAFAVYLDGPATPADTTAPVLNLPDNITQEATSPDGARVTYDAPTATDENPNSPVVSCSKNPDDAFPIGTTTVTCEATDAAGNVGRGNFEVTVRDTTAPQLNVPDDKVEEATGPGGAAVDFNASATDTVDGALEVECSPASGTTFALGTTTVDCSASDSRGNSTSGSFAVTVKDTTAPVISGMPQDITTKANSSSGAKVSYASPTATDLVDGNNVNVECQPASGTAFPLGTTTVTCKATDAANNTANDSFSVTVSYEFAGFFSPVDNPDIATNKAKAGSAILVQFSLGGDMGLDIFEADYPKSEQITDPHVTVDGVEQTLTAGSSGLSYDPASGRYTYVWKTEKNWSNTYRQLVLKFEDGTTVKRANFHFVR